MPINRLPHKKQNIPLKTPPWKHLFLSYSYETIDGTAEAGSDYIAKKETLTFQPQETHKYIEIIIIDDYEWEPDETFFVKLHSDPHDDAVEIGQHSIAEVTIINDDGKCQVFCRLF